MTADQMLRTVSTSPGKIDHLWGAPARLIGLDRARAARHTVLPDSGRLPEAHETPVPGQSTRRGRRAARDDDVREGAGS
ncbi:hypothetical protein [Streptomyces sp. NPDC054958]